MDWLSSHWPAFGSALSSCWAYVTTCGDLLSNAWARALGLSIIVYATIRVIASVYAGDMQNSEVGPVGIRPHVAKRLDRHTVVVPRAILPMNMDGVSARVSVFYSYLEADNKTRRRLLVYKSKDVRLSVAAGALPSVQSAKFGYEVPDVATEDVCFPPLDVIDPPMEVAATPERAPAYASLHRVVERWTEDDNAPLISVHPDILEEIADSRSQQITDLAAIVSKAREGSALRRWVNRGIAAKRPNVVGSYYIKLTFSHEPFFVLTRHPDRDLKMTAWLTVLTSMFALVMDAWPTTPASHADEIARRAPVHE